MEAYSTNSTCIIEIRKVDRKMCKGDIVFGSITGIIKSIAMSFNLIFQWSVPVVI